MAFVRKTLLALAALAGASSLAPAAAIAADAPVIAGARSCFWFRPPVGADPYVNVAYPDANARYWTAVFSTPPERDPGPEGGFPARALSVVHQL
jgi:hypothetical protein